MENNNSQSSGNGPPPKPWERAGGSSSGPAPFKPSSAGNTSDVVEASGTAQPGEIVSTTTNAAAAANRNTLGRPVPARPWEQQQQQTSYGTSYGGGYNSGLNYNSGYGSNMYGSSYGGLGGSYGGGMYGNSMYRGNVGGMYGGGSMYGGGMYGGGSMYGGGTMGSYGMGMGMGMGMGGAPFGEQDPNNPFGAPPSPPGFWISVMRVMQGVVNFFGRLSILIDQNTQAFHMFMSALLQLFDRSGMLYGELARFVLRILGVKTKPNKVYPPGMNGLPGPQGHQNMMEGPKAAPAGAWDGVWGGNAN